MSHADKAKKTEPSPRTTQPDSVGVHHGGFWSRRPRFESESGYLLLHPHHTSTWREQYEGMARYHRRPKEHAENRFNLEARFNGLSNRAKLPQYTQYGTGNESSKITLNGQDARNRQGKAKQAHED